MMSEINDSIYLLLLSGRAIRVLDGRIPPKVAFAIIEFMNGDLVINPQRVGKPLRDEYADLYVARRGEYRIIYAIDDVAKHVRVHAIAHREVAYRAWRLVESLKA